jgi:hypothetical protein
MALYHCEIGFPKGMKFPWGTLPLAYGNHAKQESRKEGVSPFSLPDYLRTELAQVIEAETNKDGSLQKVVYRLPFSVRDDLVLVVAFDCRPCFVKTLWFNSRTDSHPTLNKSRYDQP